jgi:hypothetical protein
MISRCRHGSLLVVVNAVGDVALARTDGGSTRTRLVALHERVLVIVP